MESKRMVAVFVCLLLFVGFATPLAGNSATATVGSDAIDGPEGLEPSTGSEPVIGSAGGPPATNDVADKVIDGNDTQAILDALIEDAMDDHNAAGATAAVVAGDEIVHLQGYGYADYETGEVVDPEETSFMVGSVAKLFVWTAVMQGVEEDRLALEEPIGEHLDDYSFEGEDEVTLEQLGTHTPGYEDRLEGIFVSDYDEAADWESNLERDMPAQVRPPGETVAYSNHGTALAGLVLQEASGDASFEEHVEAELFKPLSMDGATFEQPIPDDRSTLSNGHVPTEDGYETDDPTVVGIPPAGSMTATADDMGNFAIAMLGDGAFEGERILEPESVDAMTDQRATNHPDVAGIGYGFMLTERNGEQVVWHTGGTEYFSTLFVLFPEHDVALFVSFNTAGSGGAIIDVLDGFIEEALDGSVDDPTLEPDPATADRADAYEGVYRSTSFQTTHESLIGLIDAWEVSVADDGTLLLANPLAGEPTRWIEVERGVFVPDPNDDAAAASSRLVIEDDVLLLDAPAAPYERLSWYETPTVQLGLALLSVALLLSTVIAWPVNAYRHHGWGRMRDHLVRPRTAILGAVAILIAFVGGLLGNVIVDPDQLLYGYSIPLRITLGLLVLLPFATLAAGALVALEWRRVVDSRDVDAGSTNRYGLAYLTVLVLALVVLLWQLWYWNLLTAVTF